MVAPIVGPLPIDLYSQAIEQSAQAQKSALADAIASLTQAQQQDTAPTVPLPIPEGGLSRILFSLAAGLGGLAPQVAAQQQRAQALNQQQKSYLSLRKAQRDREIAQLEAKRAEVDSDAALKQAQLAITKAKTEEDLRMAKQRLALLREQNRIRREAPAARGGGKKQPDYMTLSAQMGEKFGPIFDQIEAAIQAAQTPKEVHAAITTFENQFRRYFPKGVDPFADQWFASQVQRLESMAPEFGGGDDEEKQQGDLSRIPFGERVDAMGARIAQRAEAPQRAAMERIQEKLDQELGQALDSVLEVDPTSFFVASPDELAAAEYMANSYEQAAAQQKQLLQSLVNTPPDYSLPISR